MVLRTRLSLPTTAALPHHHRLPSSHPDVYKTLSKLTRAALISIALEWLSEDNIRYCKPFLSADEGQTEEDSPYLAAHDVQELREYYEELQSFKGSKREVVDRIIDGDWRHGLSLYQIAVLETRYVLDRQSAQRWHALRLARLVDEDDGSKSSSSKSRRSDQLERLPLAQHQTFIRDLQRELGPIARAHYYLSRVEQHSLNLLRIQLFDTPYNTSSALRGGGGGTAASKGTRSTFEMSKSLYVAFPDATPFVYVSFDTSGLAQKGSGGGAGGTAQARSLQSIVIDGLQAIPKALSRPHERYALKTTALAAKSLTALLALRGAGRSNAAAGGWSIFAEEQKFSNALALHKPDSLEISTSEILAGDGKENVVVAGVKRKQLDGNNALSADEQAKRQKRLNQIAQGRFGCSGHEGDGKGIERLEVRIDDVFTRTIGAYNDKQQQPTEGAVPGQATVDISRDGCVNGSQKLGKSGRRKRPSLLDERSGDGDAGDADDEAFWRPDVRLSFHGSHVFAGIRKLVEAGVIDGEKMPGWMTGEAGVSIGVVREGRMRCRALGT